MAIRATRKVTPSWYTPETQKDETDPARFHLRPLTAPQLEQVFEYDKHGNFTVTPARYRDVLKFGLLDWENVNDEHDKPLKCSVATHGSLPFADRAELALEILSRSQMSEDEAKNS